MSVRRSGLGLTWGQCTPGQTMGFTHSFVPDNLLMCTHCFLFFLLESQTQALQGSDEQNQVNKQMLNDPGGPHCPSHLISSLFSSWELLFLSALLSRSVDFPFWGGKPEVLQEPGPGALPPCSQGSPSVGMEGPELNIICGGENKGELEEVE